MIVIFERGDGKIVDIDPILGLEVSLQVLHQGLNFFPVVEGIKIFLN